MDKFRKILSGKKFTYYMTTSFMVVAVIGTLFIINKFVDSKDYLFDMTADKRYSITDETRTFVGKIDKDVKIITFVNQANANTTYLKSIIDEYKKSTSKITFETYDPDLNPMLAKKYAIKDEGLNVLIIESGKKSRKIDIDMVMQDFNEGTAILESKLTGAINYVTEDKEIKTYFLKGHGEIPLDNLTSTKSKIEDGGVISEEIDITSVKEVPKDASAVVIVGPRGDISSEEKAKLEKYMQENGKMIVLLNSVVEINAARMKNLADVIRSYNIEINDDLAIETESSRVFNSHPLYLMPVLQDHQISSPVSRSGLRIAMPESRSLKIVEDKIEGLTVETIAVTSEQAWGETNLNSNNPKKDIKDITGPLNIILAAEKKSVDPNSTDKSRLIVYGNALNLKEEVITAFSASGNVELFANSIKWLSDYTDTINITPKSMKMDTVMPTETQFYLVLSVVVLLPLIFIICGTIVWMVRKRL